MDTAVRLTRVSKTFGEHIAVDALDLEVPTGSVYGFIGPNGSGKTTTLRIIMRILLPDAGRVEVLGAPSTRAANDRIGYLPEERGLYRKMSVRRLLDYYSALKGVPPTKVRSESDRWLKRMDLAAWLDKPVEALSKGMTQKLQFIATIVSRPKLLILDEPFSGLDPVNLEIMREAVLDLRAGGTTILLSTHDMSMAEEICDSICMIFRGHKVLDGTIDSIQKQYGTDTVRIQVDGGEDILKGYADLESVHDLGRCQEVRLKSDPQGLLEYLMKRTKVRHFEVVHPSLHDIFIRIASIQDDHQQDKREPSNP